MLACRMENSSKVENIHTVSLADPGGPGGAMAPLAAWASTQNALKVAIFILKIEKKISGEGQCPLPRPQLVFLCINLITT